MNAELLEIQPQELKFKFELKKQSSCSVRLVNKSNHYVAFKVKTTSPKKYCVRPNTGVIEPKSTCDFSVTMQAQRVTPPDLICKDKFLVQWTAVAAGTVDEDITPITFAKDEEKYVEEKKLRVILVSPPHSPVLSPINRTLKQVQAYESVIWKDQDLKGVEESVPQSKKSESVIWKDQDLIGVLEPVPQSKVIEDVEESTMENGEIQDTVRNAGSKTMKDVEEQNLAKDIEEMKSKLKQLESKLSETEVSILKLTEERRLTAQERENLQHDLELLRSKGGVRRVQVGFPLLFVCMVGLISLFIGYFSRKC